MMGTEEEWLTIPPVENVNNKEYLYYDFFSQHCAS